MAINDVEAEEYLAFHLEWDSEPVLSQIKKLRLLSYARAVDVNGVSPSGSGYVETYTYPSLNAAILMGWQWKLSASVELHEGDEDEIWEHCKQMVAHWSSIVGDGVIGGTQSGSGSFAIPNIAVF
jgi:hypothetical protein